MYIHSVKLINYKSFGDIPQNEIILERGVTAIIGKNESGKSNILDGLAKIDLMKNQPAAFAADIVNRNCPSGTENRYLVVLKPTAEEISALGLSGDTTIEIHKTGYSLRGSFLSYYLENIYPDVNDFLVILDSIGSNPFQLRDQDLTNYRKYYNDFKKREDINIPQKNEGLKFFANQIEKNHSEKKDTLQQLLDSIQRKWQSLICTLPVLFYRSSDKHLVAEYKYEDIEKELKNPRSAPYSLLSDFVSAIKISSDDFLLAANTGTSKQQGSMRGKIARMIAEKINDPFNEFYKTEQISLEILFNAGRVSFFVRSNEGESLSLSERSNGLKWYLETFIDALANNIPNGNVVYLLDEPGISLHVNAQRELLKLFRHLASQGNQVVYTTHSPYLLDTEVEGIQSIRAVVKDEDGYSHIYKTAYDSKIAPESQQDTLAPIISALGMNLQDTFGPAKDKINIVTEGIGDYIYISTMARFLKIDSNRYVIIPSVGAANAVNICTILHGWGCRYIALFDYDKAGVETGGEHMRKNMCLEYKKHYCYVKDVSEDEVKAKSYKVNTYMIEDLMIRTEIEKFCNENNCVKIDKTLTAKLMCNAISDKSFKPSAESIANFQELFDRISRMTQIDNDQ